MHDTFQKFDVSLADLSAADWRARMAGIADDLGYYRPLGDRHFATFIDEDLKTLLVTFESVQGIRALSELSQPIGFDMVRAEGWSHLCVISEGDTWFRDPAVFSFFDQLIDDGFFDDFEKVVFYGAGPCGYAAAAFSVAAPGATVIAVQPQATLHPDLTEWDTRFPQMRRTDFSRRYGYAPDMLEAAGSALILYDPREEVDAMHAALFRHPNVTRIRLRGMGGSIQARMAEMSILKPLLSLLASGEPDLAAIHHFFRARRDNPAYLRSLLARLEGEERHQLSLLLCRNVVARMNAPKFRRQLDALERRVRAGEIPDPVHAVN